MSASKIAALLLSAILTGTPFYADAPDYIAVEKLKEEHQILETRTEYNEYNNYRKPLFNTYKKLVMDKKLNVTYFGGSVTAGYGASDPSKTSWRAMIGQWLVDNFPDAEINNLSRALGESGTYLGAHRVKLDVIGSQPDLVFLEYSINDRYYGSSYEEAASQYETIVREIKQAYPDVDIVTVLVTDSGSFQYNKEGKLHPQAQAHEDIAAQYQIPTVHVGKVLAKTVNYSFEELKPKYAIDGVHLNDEGNMVYYRCIEEFMYNSLFCTDFSGFDDADYPMPPVISETLFDGDRTQYQPTKELLEQSEALGGKGVKRSESAYNANASYSKGTFTLDSTEDLLVIKFTGTEIAFWSNYYKEDAYYYSVDDRKFIKRMGSSHAPAIIIEGLKPGEHIVKVKIADESKPWKIGSIYTRDASKATVKGTK